MPLLLNLMPITLRSHKTSIFGLIAIMRLLAWGRHSIYNITDKMIALTQVVVQEVPCLLSAPLSFLGLSKILEIVLAASNFKRADNTVSISDLRQSL